MNTVAWLLQWRSLSFRVCWGGRSVAIRIAGRTVEATLAEGEPIEIRIAAATRKLTSGAPLQLSL
jgi:trehalose/maltose hydrolase-like predicted phosphorylase